MFKVDFHVVPPLENYDWGGKPIQLGLNGFVQFLNASLALQLSHFWMDSKNSNFNLKPKGTFGLSEEDIFALSNVVWPGRSQVLRTNYATFFLDGAHTPSSMANCVQWYQKISPTLFNDKNVKCCRILVFNMASERDCKKMLEALHSCDFDIAIFVPNFVSINTDASSDHRNFTISEDKQISHSHRLKNLWMEIHNENDRCYAVNFKCIQDVINWLESGSTCSKEMLPFYPPSLLKADQIQVLITGSLHLVGGFLSILDPSLSMKSYKGTLKNLVADQYKKSTMPGAP